MKRKANYKAEEDHELVWIEPSQCVKCLLLEHQAWAVSEALKYMHVIRKKRYHQNFNMEGEKK